MASEPNLNPSCLLKKCTNCSHSTLINPPIIASSARLKSIVESSKLRGDGLHIDLEPMLCLSTPLHVHRNCASTYTSKTHIKRFLQKQPQSTEEPVVKRSCRSDITPFKFKDQCLICGDTCLTEVDHKNRKRWRRVVQCATADRGLN